MKYEGNYTAFDPQKIDTYPISTRINKVKLEDLVLPHKAAAMKFDLHDECKKLIDTVAKAIVDNRKQSKPVLLFTGAHLIKNGFGPLIADLVNKDVLTLVAGNGATSIHDFELAMIGQTSEYVPQALEKGQFGMSYEFAYINEAINYGNRKNLGFGESLGRVICDEQFRNEALKNVMRPESPKEFKYPQMSVLATCYQKNVPFTVHVGIGTDVIDQHANFDGQAKGGCSGRDFLIYTDQICKFAKGGVALNIGSAVTGPEVLLKAVSMAANTGFIPKNIITADFDIRVFDPKQVTNESAQGYYFRDQKSVATRIPEAFGGQGYYVQGNQKKTVVYLYNKIIENL